MYLKIMDQLFFFKFILYLFKNHAVEKSHRMTKDKIYLDTLCVNPDFYLLGFN